MNLVKSVLHRQLGRFDESLVHATDALAMATKSGDDNTRFHAHYLLWKLHQHLGDAQRAELELRNASYFLSLIEVHGPEAEEVRAASSRQGPAVSQRRG